MAETDRIDPTSEKEKMSNAKKAQLVAAVFLTLALSFLIPSYAWYYQQREIARLARIKSPDTLYISAANREDKININMDEIDVNSAWNNESSERATYKYFIFSVAGQYVINYNLQLAHTKNNNYKYEIFEAEASNSIPDGVEGKDYIIYEPDNDRIPEALSSVGTHDGINTDEKIYYSIKKDNGENQISLNSGGTYTVGTGLEERTYHYDGHYLNMASGTSEYARLADDTYHDITYSYDKVEAHSEPLYWQVTNIPVITAGGSKEPFYHEYILKVSWDTSANLADLTKYKDTDIVYITACIP